MVRSFQFRSDPFHGEAIEATWHLFASAKLARCKIASPWLAGTGSLSTVGREIIKQHRIWTAKRREIFQHATAAIPAAEKGSAVTALPITGGWVNCRPAIFRMTWRQAMTGPWRISSGSTGNAASAGTESREESQFYNPSLSAMLRGTASLCTTMNIVLALT